jgi:ketosteroid isomerase-like protein
MELVNAHVRRFNNAVRDGDWQTYGEGFTEDATVTFDGVPVPPMVGRDAIVAGYLSAPPDDTIIVLSTDVQGESVSVVYAWNAEPHNAAGTMDMTITDGLISSLTVKLC